MSLLLNPLLTKLTHVLYFVAIAIVTTWKLFVTLKNLFTLTFIMKSNKDLPKLLLSGIDVSRKCQGVWSPYLS